MFHLLFFNVPSLTPWLLDFHRVQFSGSSGRVLFFKFVVILLLVVRGGKVYLPMPPFWPEVPHLCNLKHSSEYVLHYKQC